MHQGQVLFAKFKNAVKKAGWFGMAKSPDAPSNTFACNTCKGKKRRQHLIEYIH